MFLGMIVGVFGEDELGAENRENPVRCGRWIPQDQRSTIRGQSAARLDEHVEARRVHEVDAGEVKHDGLVRPHVRFDRVAEAFGRAQVDFALDVDHGGTVGADNLGREGLLHAPEP